MKRAFVSLILFLVAGAFLAQAQDQGWPRETTKNGATLITYQPQVDEWQDFQRLTWRQAASLAQPGQKPMVGVLNMKGVTAVDTDTQLVLISGIQLVSTYFPDLNATQKTQVEQQLQQFVPETVMISLHRVVASTKKDKPAPAVALNNTPPAIYIAYQPSILLLVDGQPALTDIKDTHLKAVVNANWPLFSHKDRYYLFTGQEWMVSQSLQQGWTPTTDLPSDFQKLPQDQEFADLKGTIPAPQPKPPAPQIYYSTQPSEMIEFSGQPVYSFPIPGTQLAYATNTDSILFVYQPTQQFYFLASGRWFSAASLSGPWSYATPNLPADFARIPPSDPASIVLASVPGTPEAADAVLLAQVPTMVKVDPAKAAAQVKVAYSGDPQFQPVSGTSLQYAVNTPNKVIQDGSMYYLCYQGVWFLSSSPQGPWQTATSVPQEIYTIPPSSPIYNVTYVTQTAAPDGSIDASYTAGYLGTFIAGAAVGAVIANGTGYYWPGYIGWGAAHPPYYAWPATYGAAALYNPYTGAYGMGHAAYGPYGGAAWGASYNPYTGTYAHGATAYGPYGNSRSAAEAYNPYTGGYAATRQGSSPYGSWGSSVVGNGNNWAATQHASTAYGSAGRAETSAGGYAAGVSTAHGTTGYAQTASGNMYAGHDGNVYKNTGSGWEKYGGSSSGWSSATQGTSQSSWNQRAQQSQSGEGWNRGGEQSANLDQDAQDRARGSQSADRFQQGASGGGERFGGGGGEMARAGGDGGWGDRFGGGGGSWGGGRSSWGDRGGFSGGGRGGYSGGGRRR